MNSGWGNKLFSRHFPECLPSWRSEVRLGSCWMSCSVPQPGSYTAGTVSEDSWATWAVASGQHYHHLCRIPAMAVVPAFGMAPLTFKSELRSSGKYPNYTWLTWGQSPGRAKTKLLPHRHCSRSRANTVYLVFQLVICVDREGLHATVKLRRLCRLQEGFWRSGGFGGQVRFVCGFIRKKIVVEFRTFKLAFKWPCRACVWFWCESIVCWRDGFLRLLDPISWGFLWETLLGVEGRLDSVLSGGWSVSCWLILRWKWVRFGH